MKQRGFIMPSPMILYGAIGAGVIILGLGVGLKVQSARLDSCKAEHAQFVAKVEVLGEQAKKVKIETETKHNAVLRGIKHGYAKNLDDARSNAVSRFLLNNPGSGGMRGTTVNSSGTNVTGQESLSCAAAFIQDAADDASKINSFQTWAREIGFPVE